MRITGREVANFFYHNFEPLLLSIMSICWGLWIGFPISPLYIAVVQTVDVGFVPLSIVGFVFVIAGVTKIYGLFHPYTKWLARGSMIGAVAWLWVFFLQLTLGLVSVGTILYPFFAILNGWAFIKSKIYFPVDFKDEPH